MADAPVIFMAFATGDQVLARRLCEAAQAAGPTETPLGQITLDRPELDDAAWRAEIAPHIARCDAFMILAPGLDHVGRTDSRLGRAIAEVIEARTARERMDRTGPLIGVVVHEEVPGVLDRYGLPNDLAFDRAPAAGAVDAPAFAGNEAAWLAAAAVGLRALAWSTAGALPGERPELSQEARTCRMAAERLGAEAAKAVMDAPDADRLSSVVAAVEALADLPDRQVLDRAEAVHDIIDNAVRRFRVLQAAAVVQALESASAAIGVLERSARRLGFPPPPAPSPAVTVTDPATAASLNESAANWQEAAAASLPLAAYAGEDGAPPELAAAGQAIRRETLLTAAIVGEAASHGAVAGTPPGRRPGLPLSSSPLESPIDLRRVERAQERVVDRIAAFGRQLVRLGRDAPMALETFTEVVRRASSVLRSFLDSAGDSTPSARPSPAARSPETVAPPSPTSRADRREPRVEWQDDIPGVAEPGPKMVTLPIGGFFMGSYADEEGRFGDERPRHEVRIDRVVALGAYPVTFAQWDAARAVEPALRNPSDQGWGRGKRPVIDVNVQDVETYLAFLNARLGLMGRWDAYRLPSEAEWEYACRAGTETAFAFGPTLTAVQANIDRSHDQRTTEVGNFRPNDWGLYDMHGQVFEWCEDRWHGSYRGAPTDGRAWVSGRGSWRVVRGGAWDMGVRRARSAYRGRIESSTRSNYLGFRLARTL